MQEERVLKKLEEHDRRFDGHDRRFDDHDRQFDVIVKKLDEHDRRFAEHDRRFDRLISVVLDIQATQGDVLRRLTRLEESHERTFAHIDRFLVIVDRHEAEIAALRDGQRRLESRLGEA